MPVPPVSLLAESASRVAPRCMRAGSWAKVDRAGEEPTRDEGAQCRISCINTGVVALHVHGSLTNTIYIDWTSLVL